MPRILIADADAAFARSLCAELHQRKWSAESVGDVAKALALLQRKHYDVAVVDWERDHSDGVGFLQEVRGRGMGVPVVVLSTRASIEDAVQAIKAGAQEYVGKPVDPGCLSRKLAEVCERWCPSTHVLASRLDLFIRENCASRGFHLHQLSERFRLSPRYIGKLLVTHMGASFRQRLVYFRIQMAKRLIESTDLPLYSIAEQCGFASPSRLSTAFQRQEGLPPCRYRTMNKG